MTKDKFKKLLMTISVCLFLVTCIIYCSISKESKILLRSQEITENDIVSKNESIFGASTFLKIVRSNLSTHILTDKCDQNRPRNTLDKSKWLENSNKNAFLSHKKKSNTNSNEILENLSTINYNKDNINNIVCNKDIITISYAEVISKPCSISNISCEKNLQIKDIVSYKIKRKHNQIDNNNTRNEKILDENSNLCCIVKDTNKGSDSRSGFIDEKTKLYDELILPDTNYNNTDNEVKNDEKLHEYDQTQQKELHNKNIISNYTKLCSNNELFKINQDDQNLCVDKQERCTNRNMLSNYDRYKGGQASIENITEKKTYDIHTDLKNIDTISTINDFVLKNTEKSRCNDIDSKVQCNNFFNRKKQKEPPENFTTTESKIFVNSNSRFEEITKKNYIDYKMREKIVLAGLILIMWIIIGFLKIL